MLFVALAFCATATTLAQCPDQGNCSRAWEGPREMLVHNPVGGFNMPNNNCYVLVNYCWRYNDTGVFEVSINSLSIPTPNDCSVEQNIEYAFQMYIPWFIQQVVNVAGIFVPECDNIYGIEPVTSIRIGIPTCMMQLVFDQNLFGCDSSGYYTDGCGSASPSDVCFVESTLCWKEIADHRYIEVKEISATPIQCINSMRPYLFKCAAHCTMTKPPKDCTACHTENIPCYSVCE
jgi:hypothetical protein